MTVTQKLRIESAMALISRVIEELDTESTQCEHCGLEKADNWDEKQMATELTAVNRKLEKWANK